MRLSYTLEKLEKLGIEECIAAIREQRQVIREHRDQKGDDRCWLDDYYVWVMLNDTSADLPSEVLTQAGPPMPSFEEGMRCCRDFYNFRRRGEADTTPSDAVLDPTQWDGDLAGMSNEELVKELMRIQQAIRTHRDISGRLACRSGRPRTFEDDRALYVVLPEKIPADFRLPPEDEFLGEAKSPRAGCPSFWRSHAGCSVGKHNLHQWGPCGK